MSFFYSRILSYSGDHMRIAVIHIRLVWAVKVSQPTLVFDDFQIFPGSQSGILQNVLYLEVAWYFYRDWIGVMCFRQEAYSVGAIFITSH